MTTTIVVPFKEEEPAILERTLGIAAGHPAVRRVVAVGYDRESLPPAEEAAAEVGDDGARVDVVAQQRIGSHRPGKGDGMLTGLRAALEDPGADRIHFYDADIRTFAPSWIDRAEQALDDGFDVARHFFDRAATDAQITWHVTKAGFALVWPRSLLARIEQPLGGELALTRDAAERLLAADAVRDRSDWGIDTAMTITMVAERMRIAEVFVPEGKLHGLYGSLDDLRSMATECFDTLRSLRHTPIPDADPALHRIDDPGPPPEAITTKAAFDVESTLPLLTDGWTDPERRLAEALPGSLADGFARMTAFPVWSFMDDSAWRSFLAIALDRYDHADPAWRSLFFRAWVARVLRHTTTAALRGYDEAMRSLRATVEAFRSP